MTQLGLGTVQIGMPYGGRADQPLMGEEEARATLQSAVRHGFTFLDSAIDYGLSESRIGAFLKSFPSASTEVSTKIPRVTRQIWSDADAYTAFVQGEARRSLQRLGLPRFALLQFHQCDAEFLSAATVHTALERVLESGVCSSIGISVYDPAEARLAAAIPVVTALQIPVNILDQRFVSAELLNLCRSKSVRLIARSLFLQGVLLPEAKLPAVKRAGELQELRRLLPGPAATGGRPLGQLCLDYVFGNLREVIDVGLVGADSQSVVLATAARVAEATPIANDALRLFADARDFAARRGLLNPAHWNQ